MDFGTNWFDELYLQNASKMVAYAANRLQNRAVAEELVEDAFVLLLQRQRELTAHPNLAGWLWKTLQNLILSETRKAQYRRETPLRPDFDPPDTAPPECPLTQSLPAGLTAGEREVLLLFYEQQWNHDEIAARLGISVANARVRLYRARNRCRALWEAACNETSG